VKDPAEADLWGGGLLEYTIDVLVDFNGPFGCSFHKSTSQILNFKLSAEVAGPDGGV
jgi:hypothetical protein